MINKRIIVFFSLLLSCTFCFSNEIKSIKVELNQRGNEGKNIVIYDSEKEPAAYPFVIFRDSLTGWGKKNGCPKLSPLLVPNSLPSEGIYTVYITTDENNTTQKFRILNFQAMQDLQTKVYYKTDFLQYLYEYMARKYLQTL